MTLDALRVAVTAAYETHMASGLIVETHQELLNQALAQQKETRRIWLEWSRKLHDAEKEVSA